MNGLRLLRRYAAFLLFSTLLVASGFYCMALGSPESLHDFFAGRLPLMLAGAGIGFLAGILVSAIYDSTGFGTFSRALPAYWLVAASTFLTAFSYTFPDSLVSVAIYLAAGFGAVGVIMLVARFFRSWLQLSVYTVGLGVWFVVSYFYFFVVSDYYFPRYC